LNWETVAGSRQSSGALKTSVDMVDKHMMDKGTGEVRKILVTSPSI
jgi:hypothetical protein